MFLFILFSLSRWMIALVSFYSIFIIKVARPLSLNTYIDNVIIDGPFDFVYCVYRIDYIKKMGSLTPPPHSACFEQLTIEWRGNVAIKNLPIHSEINKEVVIILIIEVDFRYSC